MNFSTWILSLNISWDSSMSHVDIACIFALRHPIDLVCVYVHIYVFMCPHIYTHEHIYLHTNAYYYNVSIYVSILLLMRFWFFLISSYYDKVTTTFLFISFCVYMCVFLVALQMSLDFLGMHIFALNNYICP